METVDTKSEPTLTIDELLMGHPENMDGRTGFTIGNGKKVYWYVLPTKNGMYQCLPIEKDGTLGWPRFVTSDAKVTIRSPTKETDIVYRRI